MALPFHKLLQTLSSGSSIGSAAVAILSSYGTDAHIYLPGIGALNGYTLGNWLDSGGTTPATVDNPVGLVQDGIGSIHVSQGTTASKPILRKPSNNYYWEFDGVNDILSATAVPFIQSDDHAVIVGTYVTNVSGPRVVFGLRSTASDAPIVAQLQFQQTTGILSGYWRDDASATVILSGSSNLVATNLVASALSRGGRRSLRHNGAELGFSSASFGATTTTTVGIGGRAVAAPAAYMAGNVYPIIAIKGTVSDADLLILERWVGSLTGPTGVMI